MSSSVILQVGQCGNQLGLEFWDLVSADSSPVCDTASRVWRNNDGFFRSVNVDTEPKVVRQLKSRLRMPGNGRFRDCNVIAGKCGRGSNWAMGYYHEGGCQLNEGENVFERTMESLRRETERCDCFQGVVMLHSLAGGTGSGVGSKLAEMIRDEYGIRYLMSCAVVPFQSGESPLQQYNSVLALSSLLTNADSVLLLHNDDALATASQRLKHSASTSGRANTKLSDMNRYFATCLAGTFLPLYSIDSSTTHYSGIGSEPWDLVRTLAPNPQLKILHMDTASKLQDDDISGEPAWNEFISNIGKPLNTDALGSDFSSQDSASELVTPSEQVTKSDRSSNSRYAHVKYISSIGIVRGNTSDSSLLSAIKKLENKIVKHSVHWNPFPMEFWMESKSKRKSQNGTSLTVVLNCDRFVDQLKCVLASARSRFAARAFLHWYHRHGCTDEDFSEAFDNVESVVECYNQATRISSD